jgi:Xaa-Pro aminopeptidase
VLLRELRVRKTPAELDVIREAVRITGDAHRAAMRATRPGVMEYEIEALVDYTFRSQGGSGPGYTTIVGTGANACILHYVAARGKLESGDLILVDAGCEYGWYTADVTRTWPVDGRFEGAGRDVYQVVFDANRAAVDAARVGCAFSQLQEVAAKVLTQGMVDLGILKGDPDDLFESGAYRRYYMHNIGHWLGLDVHDVGLYCRDGMSRPLEAGMLLTIEPGMYLPADDQDLPEAFRGIGVRIEDDVLITEKGPDILTREIPVTIENIEACMADSG